MPARPDAPGIAQEGRMARTMLTPGDHLGSFALFEGDSRPRDTGEPSDMGQRKEAERLMSPLLGVSEPGEPPAKRRAEKTRPHP